MSTGFVSEKTIQMKRMILPFLLVSILSACAQQKSSSGGILGKASEALGKMKGGGLSNEDIVAGLKEALSVGAQNSSSKLSATDGFLPMPLLRC